MRRAWRHGPSEDAQPLLRMRGVPEISVPKRLVKSFDPVARATGESFRVWRGAHALKGRTRTSEGLDEPA